MFGGSTRAEEGRPVVVMIEPDRFHFLDPGPLIDGDLELVPPHARWVGDILAICEDGRTVREDPAMARTSQQNLFDFLSLAPAGHQPGDGQRSPSYHFWMYCNDPRFPYRIVGGISLRIGWTPELLLYSGHIGYHVYPPARGNHLAERACRLVLPLARRHGLQGLWITVNPDNFPSRRTCERLGAALEEIQSIPSDHPFYARGERYKCRYYLPL